MRPKLNGSYSKLLAESAEVRKAIAAMSTSNATRLTAREYVRAQLAAASSTMERLKELEAKIAERPELEASVRKFMAALKGPHYPTAVREARRISPILTVHEEAALLAIGSSSLEAFALAAHRLAQTQPEVFGTCENLREHEAKVLELVMRQDELYERLEAELPNDEIQWADLRADGYAHGSVRMTGGEVAVGPGLGKRLTDWVIAQEQPKSHGPVVHGGGGFRMRPSS